MGNTRVGQGIYDIQRSIIYRASMRAKGLHYQSNIGDDGKIWNSLEHKKGGPAPGVAQAKAAGIEPYSYLRMDRTSHRSDLPPVDQHTFG
jgi:hypothetical protein